MSERFLSKSKIIAGLQCPKRLYLEVYQPELVVEDAERAWRFSEGHRVGEVARSLCAGGKLIDYDQGLPNAIKETRVHLEDSPRVPLFEATFVHDDVLIRADLFSKRRRGFHLVEVKNAASVKDYYVSDCAIQAWVIEGAGYTLNRVELAHVDTSFVYKGNGDYRGLLHHEDVTKAARSLRDQVPGWVKDCRKHLKGKMPEIDIGDHCDKPYKCPFFDHCSPEESGYPVTKLPRGGKVAKELLAKGISDVRDIPEGYLRSEIHEWVRRVTVSGKAELDPEAKEFMSDLSYPRYYLDFETIHFAVPIWAGTRPYQKLPFQWSCHVENKRGKLQHHDFLDVSGNAPMRSLAEKLLAVMGDTGPVLVYGNFEKPRLSELGLMFPDLADRLSGIADRVIDLLPLARRFYYHPEMRGSWSLKDVLPTIAPDLRYDELQEVQEGSSAQLAYLEAIDPATSNTRRRQLKQSLLRYCELDTLALVKVARFF